MVLKFVGINVRVICLFGGIDIEWFVIKDKGRLVCWVVLKSIFLMILGYVLVFIYICIVKFCLFLFLC